MKNITGSFQSFEDGEHGWMWIGDPVEILGGTEVEISDNKFNITPGFQKVIFDSSYNTTKSANDMYKVVFRVMLQKTTQYNRKPVKGRFSCRENCI